YIDGRPAKLHVDLDDINQSFSTSEPFRVGAGGGADKRFVGGITDVRIYDHVVAAEDAASLACADSIARLLFRTGEQHTPAQAHKVRSYFLEAQAPQHINRAVRQMPAARAKFER